MSLPRFLASAATVGHSEVASIGVFHVGRQRASTRQLFAALLLPFCCAASAASFDPSHWQDVARKDLDAAHQAIAAAHPGAIDDLNPSFRTRIDSGYRAALALVPRVHDYSSMLDVTRFYIAGFEDGHLLLSDNTRPDDAIRFVGWIVHLVRGRYIVYSTAARWDAPLPPLGAELVRCDGRAPQDIVAQDVAPYHDRRDLVATAEQNARYIALPFATLAPEVKRCTFRGADGKSMELAAHYQETSFSGWSTLLNAGGARRVHRNSYNVYGSVLWIEADNFQPDQAAYASLQAMLRRVRALHGIRKIIFDVRGNAGGDSRIGDLIFDAATGGLAMDIVPATYPEVYAQWRVSPIAVASARWSLARSIQSYGTASQQAYSERRFLKDMLLAGAAGEPWVRQADGDRRLTRDDVARLHGHLRNFDGLVVVLTSDHCVSACLNFVDEVVLAPNSMHLGQVTSADSIYIDGPGLVKLPSGNMLIIPLKVWRNRPRGNNEPLTPDYAFDGDIDDDAAVRRWVMSIVDNAPSRR
jgi:hypothetical protein